MENMDNSEKKIMIPMEDGTEKEATCISLFKIEELDKMFLIYTFGEQDDNGMEVIHVSRYEEKEDDLVELTEVEPSDWEIIKEYLREIIKGEEE